MPKFVSCGEVSWYMLLPFAVAIITSLHYLILKNLFEKWTKTPVVSLFGD